MGERPLGTSLDRIDPNGHYEASNCRWATQKEQCNNRTNQRTVEYRGRRMSIAQLSDETGIEYSCLYKRIVYRKVPVEDAVRR